jgi:hypothetical protein
MRIKRILLLFLVLIFFVFCSKENETKVSMIKYINAEGGLKMRDLPDANGKVVTLIPNASEVSVIKETGSEIEISGKKGKWTEVSYTNKTGWVFGGFLSKEKPESEVTNSNPNQLAICQEKFTNLINDWPKAPNGALLYSAEDIQPRIREAVAEIYSWKCRAEFDEKKLSDVDADTYCYEKNLYGGRKFDKECVALVMILWGRYSDPFINQ